MIAAEMKPRLLYFFSKQVMNELYVQKIWYNVFQTAFVKMGALGLGMRYKDLH